MTTKFFNNTPSESQVPKNGTTYRNDIDFLERKFFVQSSTHFTPVFTFTLNLNI